MAGCFSWMDAQLLGFADGPVNATYGGSSGIRNEMIIISGPRLPYLRCIGSVLRSAVGLLGQVKGTGEGEGEKTNVGI